MPIVLWFVALRFCCLMYFIPISAFFSQNKPCRESLCRLGCVPRLPQGSGWSPSLSSFGLCSQALWISILWKLEVSCLLISLMAVAVSFIFHLGVLRISSFSDSVKLALWASAGAPTSAVSPKIAVAWAGAALTSERKQWAGLPTALCRSVCSWA